MKKRISLTHTVAPFQAIKAMVPSDRFLAKIRRTLIGMGLCALGIAGAVLWSWPWYPVVLLCLVGANMVSADFVKASLPSALGMIRDLAGALKSKGEE